MKIHHKDTPVSVKINQYLMRINGELYTVGHVLHDCRTDNGKLTIDQLFQYLHYREKRGDKIFVQFILQTHSASILVPFAEIRNHGFFYIDSANSYYRIDQTGSDFQPLNQHIKGGIYTATRDASADIHGYIKTVDHEIFPNELWRGA